MPNRMLTPQELEKANALLQDLRSRLRALAGEEADLLFAYRRKVAKELVYDERSKPAKRSLLKRSKMIAQKGLCAACQMKLPKRGAELDRLKAMDRYTEENTRLVHHECHVKSQEEKGFS